MKREQVLTDYQIVDVEFENSTSIVYKGYSLQDNQLVLLKTAKQPNNAAHQMAASIHEFHMTKDLDMDGIIQPIQIVKHLADPYLVLEYFSGVTLKKFLENQKLDILAFLSIAIKLTSVVSNLHKQQIIHKNINPENIVFNPVTGQLKMIGFQYATKLKTESPRKHTAPHELEGQLAYLAPEQTGRMNRSVDYRADLYSLGVLFYEMTSNTLPFTAKEPIELIYAHLTKMPQNPSKLNEQIPMVLANIMMKLLSKIPANRYQSAFGLREDLKKCIDQLQLFGKVETFPLAQEDPIAVFETGSKLYGREKEIEKLLKAFERVKNGQPEIVFIQGHSGIGKTALVNEIQVPLVREKGYFISGKFDLLQRQKPYSPVIHAFKSLIRQIFTEGKERIQSWKEAIEWELLGNVAVITAILPELKWIVGDRSMEEEISSTIDAHLRFHLVFQKFVNTVATKDHPLVLFLDDLQWADTASLRLIEYLLTHVDCRYFLVIGAYRDHEVGLEHLFMETIHNLKKEHVTISEIPLLPLEEEAIFQWVEETIMDDGNDSKKLADRMFRITQGNPFFIKQLFQSFSEDGTIFFHTELGKWRVQFEKVKKTLEKETIVDLMVQRVQQLPSNSQTILKLASCIGNEFNLAVLSIICEEEYDLIGRNLWDALDAGLILPEDPSYKWVYPETVKQLIAQQPPAYRFLHDRVRQAVYSSMTKTEQEKAHLKIGRLLVKVGLVEENLFDIVNHLNSCKRYLRESEWLLLVEWNVKAGEQAKLSAAFKESLTYFQTAYEMLGAAWETNYDLTKRLMTGLGECHYLNSEFKEAEFTFNQVLEHARTNHEKLAIYNLKIVLYTHVHWVKEAVESGIAGLRLFGWDIHRNPSKALVVKELVLVKLALWGKKTDDFMTLPKLKDQEKRLVLNTMITMNAPSFHVDQNLATILMLRAMRFSLKHGITDLTSLVFNNYALILSSGFSDFHKSYQFGKLAIEFVESSGNAGLKGRVYFVFGSFINHWKHPLKYNLDYLQKSQQYCIEAGNIHLAGANSSFIAITLFMMGDDLQEVRKGIKNQFLFIDQIRYVISKGFLKELIHWIEVLMNKKTISNWKFEQVLEDDSAKIIHYTLRLQLSYLFHEEKFAILAINHLEKLVNRRLTLVVITEFYFYDALWAAIMYQSAAPSKQKSLYKKLKRNANKLGTWAKLCPENYLHKWNLVTAEIARLDQNHSAAIDYYDRAIQTAMKNNFIQDVAISNEAAGRYYFSKGLESIGIAYVTEAYRHYKKWGADAKASKLLKEYQGFILKDSTNSHFQFSHSLASQFDMDAFLKASQTIAGEIVQENLVKKLMNITMRNAGAERGVLLLNRGGQLYIVARAGFDGKVDDVSAHQLIEESSEVSKIIVYYVVKSREAVVLNDATVEGMFVDDPYIVEHKPKSILCLPTMYKGEVNSVLYLENNQTTYAFTEERTQFLSFLSTQAAISIENAELFGKLEEKVKERTKELEIVNQNLEQVNQEIARSESERRHLVSNISHDLRAPIASVKGYIEAILDGLVDTEEQREDYLRKCLNRVNGLNSMINDLFELAQLESGHIHFSFDIVPIDRLIRRLSEQFEYDVKRNGLFFKLTMEEIELPEYPLVQIDVKRLSQVFSNIFSNAIKHTDAGGITISLRFNETIGDAYIAIRDTGKGILEEDLPYIFDRNFTKSTQGNGLGLAICREIILLHNGEIWAESKLGEGTAIYIRLPVFQVEYSFVE